MKGNTHTKIKMLNLTRSQNHLRSLGQQIHTDIDLRIVEHVLKVPFYTHVQIFIFHTPVELLWNYLKNKTKQKRSSKQHT